VYSFHSFLFFIITVVFPLLYFETYKNNIKHWFDSKPDCYCWIQNTEEKERKKIFKKKSFGAKMLLKETLKKFHIGKRKKTINIFQIEYYFVRLRCTQYAFSYIPYTFFISLKECQLAPFRFLLESTKNENERRNYFWMHINLSIVKKWTYAFSTPFHFHLFSL
jgi:hypothetical protein